jgi:hypothetical protein
MEVGNGEITRMMTVKVMHVKADKTEDKTRETGETVNPISSLYHLLTPSHLPPNGVIDDAPTYSCFDSLLNTPHL